MKKIRALTASLGIKIAFLVIASSAASSGASAQADNKISIGEVVTIESTVLNEKRRVLVHMPRSASSTIYAKARYPVVYLFDGDAHFSSVVGMIEELSTANGNMISPEMIVVGIPNTDRTRDLTPTHVEPEKDDPFSAFNKTSGGGEKFLSFMETELIPYIDSHYPTAPYKMLIGHSLGGLMVMQTLVHHTNMFNSYVAIDPSMWWDNRLLLNETKNALAEKQFAGRSLYLGIANTMEDGMDLQHVRQDKSKDTQHIRSILDLRDYLESGAQNGLKYQGKYYPTDDHGSVPLITEYDALHFFFSFYPLNLTIKDFTDSDAMAVKFEKHFKDVSKAFGYEVKPPEVTVNSYGYQALGSKQLKQAESFFKMNVVNYPASLNVYDSYGDYFAAVGDKENAIIQYKKALTIGDNAGTKKKLDKLQGTAAVPNQ